MVGISTRVISGLENRRKFNGIEQTNVLSLNQYDAYYRNLDPQIGRWWQIDPKCESFDEYSPYNHVLNNPISTSDFWGDDTTSSNILPTIWPNFNPANDVVVLNQIKVTPSGASSDRSVTLHPPFGWKVMKSRSVLYDVFFGQRTYGPYKVYADGTLSRSLQPIMGTAPSAGFAKGPAMLKIGGSLRTVIKEFRWSTKTVAHAAKALNKGAREVVVKTRAEAEELFAGLYLGRGFRNTTGMSGVEAKGFFGKAGTYHWDDAVDASGRVVGHGAGNAHGAMPHLQVHDEHGAVFRIFFQ